MNNASMQYIKREDYKAVKHMNREDLTNYLYRIYKRGFDAGAKSVAVPVEKKTERTQGE